MTSSLLVAPAPVERAAPTPRLRRVRYEPEPTTTGSAVGSPVLTATAESPVPVGWLVVDRPAARRQARAGGRAIRAAPPGSSSAGSVAVDPPNLTKAAPGSRPVAHRRRVAPEASPAERIEAHHATVRQLRTALEVFDGRRPLAHVADQVAPAVLRYLRVAAQQRRARGPARFTRMRLCLPSSGVAEVAVTCDIDGRPRALAARFERTRGRWLCTALRLG